MVLDWTRNKY